MYFVIEIQKLEDGTYPSLVNAFEDKSLAESSYYNILSYAARRTLPVHGAYFVDEYGSLIDSKFYHKQDEVESESGRD